MDLTKLENSCFRFDNDYFNLVAILENALGIINYSASTKGIGLKITVDCLDSLRFLQKVWGDEHRFLQIILNFLTNAIKFTDRGGEVSINLKLKSKQPIKKKTHIDHSILREIMENNIDISTITESHDGDKESTFSRSVSTQNKYNISLEI